MSSLVDIHVLEETESRVEELAKAITKQVGIVEQASLHVHRALGPSPQKTRNLGQYRENAASLLKAFELIEQQTREIHDLHVALSAGVNKWQHYVALVQRAEEQAGELAGQPALQRFPQLLGSAQQNVAIGVDGLVQYVARLAPAVFVPPEAARFIATNEQVPLLPADELGAFAKLLTEMEQWDCEQAVEAALAPAIKSFYTKSLTPTVRGSPEASSKLPELCEQYYIVLEEALKTLCGRNPARMRRLSEVNRAACAASTPVPPKSTSPQAPSTNVPKATSPKASSPTPGMAPMVPPQHQTQHRGSSAKTGPVLAINTNVGDRSRPFPATAGVGSPAPITPGPSNPAPFSTPGAAPPGPFSAAPVESPVTLTPKPSTGPLLGTPKMGTPGSQSTGTPGTPPGTVIPGSEWAPFDFIEHSRTGDVPPEDLARAKRDGLATLVHVLQNIAQQSRRIPITSEFAVSAASIQFMQTLQHISNCSHGVDVVLLEAPTRAYISKPHPSWAARQPSAAGRANPVSQYFADCIDMLYVNLHQYASEQLQDKTKTGIFMLSNLSSIEHYITDSKEGTLQTVQRKSQLMDAMGDVALQRFQRLTEQSFKEYLTDWSKLAPVLMESTLTTTATSGKMSNKDREQIKDKFRTFNAEFEVLTDRERRYQVADPVLRHRMTQEVSKLIQPLYMRFYSKHGSGDFTKNKHKYVKYDMEQFNVALNF